MIKPSLPNLPGVGVMTDTLDFVKTLWGSMNVPGMSMSNMATPTLSVEELDKKIAELQTVEAWLNVNASMLRSTIQALEVQRGTIATLKSMGASLANAVKQPGASDKSILAAAPFVSALFPQGEAKAEAAPSTAAPAPAPDEPEETEDADAPAGAAAAAAAMGNPSVWWNMLQDQFKQAVSSAMSADAIAGAAAMAQDAATKFAANASKAVSQPIRKRAAKPTASSAATAKPKPAAKAKAKPKASSAKPRRSTKPAA
ncbi:PhaM family polyhydroxyalkanoate granule multifunctional regulatory protein [Massilia sp. TS11]|uniref:PhaM family polyhydroxyalkanoate granule multifunctional regulatory protein n=1 Tax=Massilia sp. TS11 TaxID=2908003 RepID=UPI001EDA5E71|nr:PhaM family polyhydroxyalkanoate granule multifunctional regulatory protein [Massilia sp. TS11]MCG2585027.1 hypothetical protein [Massilia sp. TS11]